MSKRKNLQRRAKAKIHKLIASLTPEQLKALTEDIQSTVQEKVSR
jgi:hypothetical protein